MTTDHEAVTTTTGRHDHATTTRRHHRQARTTTTAPHHDRRARPLRPWPRDAVGVRVAGDGLDTGATGRARPVWTAVSVATLSGVPSTTRGVLVRVVARVTAAGAVTFHECGSGSNGRREPHVHPGPLTATTAVVPVVDGSVLRERQHHRGRAHRGDRPAGHDRRRHGAHRRTSGARHPFGARRSGAARPVRHHAPPNSARPRREGRHGHRHAARPRGRRRLRHRRLRRDPVDRRVHEVPTQTFSAVVRSNSAGVCVVVERRRAGRRGRHRCVVRHRLVGRDCAVRLFDSRATGPVGASTVTVTVAVPGGRPRRS